MRKVIIVLVILVSTSLWIIFSVNFSSDNPDLKIMKSFNKKETIALIEEVFQRNNSEEVAGRYCSVPLEFVKKHTTQTHLPRRGRYYWIVGAKPVNDESDKDELIFLDASKQEDEYSHIFTSDARNIQQTPPFDFGLSTEINIINDYLLYFAPAPASSPIKKLLICYLGEKLAGESK